MSDGVNQPAVRPVAPTEAPSTSSGDARVDFYQRAVAAKPTGFAENPIGTMASAVDRLGRAAGNLIAGKEMEGQDGLANAEARLKKANAAVRAR